MEPSDKENNLNDHTENNTISNSNCSKRNRNPQSSLSASESEGEEQDLRSSKKNRIDATPLEFPNAPQVPEGDDFDSSSSPITLPMLKIQPVLGGSVLSFPVHPRLTLVDLKDFILFNLNIPHSRQVISFIECDPSNQQRRLVLLSSFSESTLLCSIPGLIDEVTGRCAPLTLSFKMASGMDVMNVYASESEYESAVNSIGGATSEYFSLADSEGNFEFQEASSPVQSTTDTKLSSLAASLISVIPLPPGVTKTSKMLLRSLSKSSPANNNLPSLWEIYFPESGIKMMVTAVINVNEVPSEGQVIGNSSNINTSAKESTPLLTKSSPSIVISPPEDDINTNTNVNVNTNTNTTNSISNVEISDKNYCEKCKIRCRPALRFICKCKRTFCQIHRYPDQHSCTFDHRAEGLATIQANNPKIIRDKIGNI
jgi:hypothetical protein